MPSERDQEIAAYYYATHKNIEAVKAKYGLGRSRIFAILKTVKEAQAPAAQSIPVAAEPEADPDPNVAQDFTTWRCPYYRTTHAIVPGTSYEEWCTTRRALYQEQLVEFERKRRLAHARYQRYLKRQRATLPHRQARCRIALQQVARETGPVPARPVRRRRRAYSSGGLVHYPIAKPHLAMALTTGGGGSSPVQSSPEDDEDDDNVNDYELEEGRVSFSWVLLTAAALVFTVLAEHYRVVVILLILLWLVLSVSM